MADFATEAPDLRTRRHAAIGALNNAIQQLTNALARGYLWPFEKLTAGGIALSAWGTTETPAAREGRLRHLITDLISLTQVLDRAPIPDAWLKPVMQGTQWTFAASGKDQDWVDANMFFVTRQTELGQAPDRIFLNDCYIDTDPVPTKAVPRVVVASGIGLGIFIVVPDPENKPLSFHRVWNNDGVDGKGIMAEVEQDDFGYFYRYQGQRHYLPERPQIGVEYQ